MEVLQWHSQRLDLKLIEILNVTCAWTTAENFN